MAVLRNVPKLTALASLGHQWRHVATSDGTTRWFGDLADPVKRSRFFAMRQAGDIVSVRGRTEVYAKIAQDRPPADAHRRAVASSPGEPLRAKREYVRKAPFVRRAPP